VLTEANFEQTVLGSQDVWFVEFYAPWCGHCKHLEPEWNAVATAMKGSKVKFGKVDATVESSLAGRFGVNGYPTIKYWGYGGDKSVGNAETYQSTRTAEALQAFANDLLEKANIDPEIRELVGQKVFDENCEGAKICLMLFVPNIYDSNANERNNYISQLLEVAKRNRKQPVVFFWLAAGDQLDLELLATEHSRIHHQGPHRIGFCLNTCQGRAYLQEDNQVGWKGCPCYRRRAPRLRPS